MSDVSTGIIAFLVIVLLWVPPIILGVRAAHKNHRSAQWMWFGIHPMMGWIAYAVLANLPPLKECPQCAEKVKAHARICAYCMTPFNSEPHP